MKEEWLKEFLDEKVRLYNRQEFIDSDPISIPHQFSKKADIEISALLTATIAWGKRSMIISNAKHLLKLMDNAPYDFIRHATLNDLLIFQKFKHRTFNSIDVGNFILALQEIYKEDNGLEKLFEIEGHAFEKIEYFHLSITNLFSDKRSIKHVSSPAKGSAAKRINMFLRWMVRKDYQKVDFGIWNCIASKDLICPLDVHSGNVGRKLGLLSRKQNDWLAAEELTQSLRLLDADDPVKYDFALFGLGVFEGFR